MAPLAPPAYARALAGIDKPPYSGAVIAPLNSVYQFGCGTAKNLKSASWNATSGRGVLSEYAYAKPCATHRGSVGTSSDATASGGFDVSLPIAVAGNGSYHVKAVWLTAINASRTLSPGKCTASSSSSYSCDQSASWYLLAYISLYDSTNGSYIPSSSEAACWQTGCNQQAFFNDAGISLNNTQCSSGKCSTTTNSYVAKALGSHLTFFFNTSYSLVSNHSYDVELYFEGDAYAHLDAYNTYIAGGFANSTVSAASSGSYLKLSSISWK